jgi:hypothetical protein
MNQFYETIRIGVLCMKEAILHPRSPVCEFGNPASVPPQSAAPWWGSGCVLILVYYAVVVSVSTRDLISGEEMPIKGCC